MKKSLLALAALSTIAGTAAAQSSITMYGIADVGVVRESGNPKGPVTKVTSGISAGSRLGFRGVEDLGGGMAAIFTMETGINMDTGGAAQGATNENPGGTLFARQSFVGLKSNAGTLTLGRQYNPFFFTSNAIDPFGSGHIGQAGNVMQLTGVSGRSSNSIMYTSPSFSGFKAELLYAFGELVGSARGGSVINGAISYTNGPLLVRLAANQANTDTVSTSSPKRKDVLLGAVYDFKVVKMSAGYATLKGPTPRFFYNQEATGFYTRSASPTPYRLSQVNPATLDMTDILIGATIPAGPGNILASYIRHKDRTSANQNASQAAIGYEYYLSKRTVWYTDYSRIRNDNNAGFTVGNSGDATGGAGDKAFSTGIRHTF